MLPGGRLLAMILTHACGVPTQSASRASHPSSSLLSLPQASANCALGMAGIGKYPMPVSRSQQRLYPGGSLRSPEWLALRTRILRRAGYCCEGVPGEECGAPDRTFWADTSKQIVLTIAHLNHNPQDNHPSNLRALCQRCHNRWDAPHRTRSRKANRRIRSLQLYFEFSLSLFSPTQPRRK